MADIPETLPAPSTKDAAEKRKPDRPSTGQALSRATSQCQYRQRINSNVTKNTVEALDENMALRAQVLQLMNELEDAQMKARVEFDLGEKARARVRELERRLASVQTGSKRARPRRVMNFKPEIIRMEIGLEWGLWDQSTLTRRDPLPWQTSRCLQREGRCALSCIGPQNRPGPDVVSRVPD